MELTIITDDKGKTLRTNQVALAIQQAKEVNYVSSKEFCSFDWSLSGIYLEAWLGKNVIFPHVIIDLDATDRRFAAFMYGYCIGGATNVYVISGGKTKDEFGFSMNMYKYCQGVDPSDNRTLTLRDDADYVLAGIMYVMGCYSCNLNIVRKDSNDAIDNFVVGMLSMNRTVDMVPSVSVQSSGVQAMPGKCCARKRNRKGSNVKGIMVVIN